MTTSIVPRDHQLNAVTLEKVLLDGDLQSLTPAERVQFYAKVCESLQLNPLTKPFDYLMLNDKLTLYARKDATDQLRNNKGVSIQITSRELVDDLYIVTARATDASQRTDESIGAVPLAKADGEWKTAQSGKRYFAANGKTLPLSPDERANAIMKAETKAKRRVTLSFCGLGIVDESEIESIAGARRVTVTEDGEIVDAPARTATQPRAPQPERAPAAPKAEAKAAANPDYLWPDIPHFATKGELFTWGLREFRLTKKADLLSAAGYANDMAIADLQVAAERMRGALGKQPPAVEPEPPDEGIFDEQPGEEGGR